MPFEPDGRWSFRPTRSTGWESTPVPPKRSIGCCPSRDGWKGSRFPCFSTGRTGPIRITSYNVCYTKLLRDIYTGLVKAAAFGFLIALISCYHGFIAEGGAEGVGRATTRAVVTSSMMVLVSDYFMTSYMF